MNALAIADAGNNLAPMLKDLNKLLKSLGADSIKSTLAKPRMAIAICRAAADGVIGEDDAEATYNAYLDGRRAETGKNTMAEGHADGKPKSNISKNMKIIQLGLLPKVDGPALLERVNDLRVNAIRTGGDDLKVKPTFDCFVDAARAQLAQPNEELTDEQINGIVIKPEGKENTLLDNLIADHKRLNKRLEELPSAAIENAIRCIEDAMCEINGGKLPPLSKEDKKAEEAMAFLRKMGKL